MKQYKVELLVILLIIAIVSILTTTVKAEIIDTNNYKPGEVTESESSKITSIAGTVLATIRNIGIISSVVIMSIIGLKYMLGSLEEKANYKENMLPYIIGCLLLAMSATIPSIIYDIIN